MNRPAHLSDAPLTPMAAMDESTEARIHRVFAAQAATALRLRTSTLKERLAKLERLRQSVLAHREAVIAAGAADFGKPASEVEMMELLPVILEIGDARKHLRKWMRPRPVAPTGMTLGTQSQVRYEPRGRCLIVAPWNYPLTLTLGPLVPAIAAGNTVIIKTSELTPRMSSVMASIVRACFDEHEVALFEGDAGVATALLAQPFDHLFFTGSPAIGKLVMAAAARHLGSVTLELGGKSPTIVDATADIELAAQTVAWGKFANNGQTCIAPDHVYVQRSAMPRFVDALKAAIVGAYGAGDAPRTAPLARIVNARHARRIVGLLDDARRHGATVLHGGEVDEASNYVAPTLLTDVPAAAKIMEEEIFGPLLPLIPFDGLDEVIGKINAAPKPLALYVWSKDQAAIDKVLDNTSSGGACINHVMAQFMHHGLPFGGVNHSGIGSYHGEYGFKAFSHERAVVRAKVLLAKMFFLPHTPFKRRVVDWMLRHL